MERTNRTVGVLTTNGRDGHPHSAPVGVRWEDGALRFETDSNATKMRNLQADPRVSILVFGKPKWGVLIFGTAEILSKGTGSVQSQIRVRPQRKTSWKRKED
ncbi:MAG: pyridoxamine 5'-phosphate oxidase family protein [Actinomycetota bacterium]